MKGARTKGRPRICWFCLDEGGVAVQVQRRSVYLARDGTRDEGPLWESRFLCADHEHLDPWDQA